ncbi:unnamed protein product [Brassica oleracea]
MGSQEHFYMEPHGSLVWTSDGGNEDPHRHQQYVSHVLGLPMSKVISLHSCCSFCSFLPIEATREAHTGQRCGHDDIWSPS